MSEEGAYDAHALHGFAHDSIARGSKSFALASQLFDRETRERVWLLYAWCRAADDLTEAELNRARAQVEAGLLMALETPQGRADSIARSISFSPIAVHLSSGLPSVVRSASVLPVGSKFSL